ncbi:hypothetical protein EU523_01965 [Candidatus Heimdallarchaeota archaeon]|nr:MAG: hypothetical protein EU523_01965 [Candidatus Heimdallarchaeota archaeon]
MSQAAWYPETDKTRWKFFLRSFPLFVVLGLFFYFGLDKLGAFEFLELLVRDNSVWLLKIIYNIDPIEISYFERIDFDPFSTGFIFTDDFFPGIEMSTYPRKMIIIRACTGMEAGALLMALIFVTPAKWENKILAHITNLLMMHVGNTFRIAFHFWFTQYLYTHGVSLDKAFYYAHDMLSKVFGFIGIIIFTLVIERTGVKIVSTFGTWLDTIGMGIKKLTNVVKKRAFYIKETSIQNPQSQISTASASTTSEGSYKDIDEIIDEKKVSVDTEGSDNKMDFESHVTKKINFYPWESIKNNNWKFFKKSFQPFFITVAIIILLGLIPQISFALASASDWIATDWFGASLDVREKVNLFWWQSTYVGADSIAFVSTIFSNGLFLLAILIGLVLATPAKTNRKIIAGIFTFLITITLMILNNGLVKSAIWSLANNETMKTENPMRYLNLADLLPWGITLITVILILVIVFIINHLLKVKTFYTLYAWLHQLFYWLAGIIGILPEKTDNEPNITPTEMKSD